MTMFYVAHCNLNRYILYYTSSHTHLTSSLGMDHPLWYPLSVKVSHLIDEGKVLYEHWASLPNSQSGCLAVHRVTLAGRQYIRNLNTEYLHVHVYTIYLGIFTTCSHWP